MKHCKYYSSGKPNYFCRCSRDGSFRTTSTCHIGCPKQEDTFLSKLLNLISSNNYSHKRSSNPYTIYRFNHKR